MRTQIVCVYIVLGFIVHQASGAESDSTSHLIIRSIRIEGNSVTQSQVITREMALHVGDTLSEAKLIQDRDHIYNLELFNKVTVTHADTEAFADLLVTVIERWYIFPYPNFDLRSRDMSTLSYGLGVSDQNFLGRNEKLSVSFSTGYNKTASLNYQNPRLIDQDIFLRTTFSYRDSHNLSNSSNEFELINRLASISLGKRFGLFQTLIGTIGYQQLQIPDTSLGRTVSPDGTDRFLEFGLEYTYDARNVREYPTDGFYFDATTMNNGFGRESTIKTFTYASDFRWYTIWDKFLTLALRGFESFVSGGVVPVYHDLFLNSRLGVRGYNQRDYQGEDIVGGSAEIRIPVIAPRFITFNFLNIHQFNTMRFGIYAALFADIGKIWFRSNLFDDVPWLASVGLGLHFLLPYSTVLRVECSTNALGQIRIDATSGVPF